MILLDTSVLSLAFRRRRPGVKERQIAETLARLMRGKNPLGLSGVVLQEILSGIRTEKQFVELKRLLLTAFSILLPTEDDFIDAAKLNNHCLSKGVTLWGPDCLIAAQAISAGHELFSSDPDFSMIAKHSTLKLFSPEPHS